MKNRKQVEVTRMPSGKVWPKLGSVMRLVREKDQPVMVQYHGTDHVAIISAALYREKFGPTAA